MSHTSRSEKNQQHIITHKHIISPSNKVSFIFWPGSWVLTDSHDWCEVPARSSGTGYIYAILIINIRLPHLCTRSCAWNKTFPLFDDDSTTVLWACLLPFKKQIQSTYVLPFIYFFLQPGETQLTLMLDL